MNTHTGRLDAVKSYLSRTSYSATFTSLDIARVTKGFTPEQIDRSLVLLAKVGEVEKIGKQEREGGGHGINVYQRIKKVELTFEHGLAGGVWADLYMIPLPVTQKGRVHVCHG